MEYFRTKLGGESIAIRSLEAPDVEPIVEYWHGASPEFLDRMNVDPAKLVSRDATRSSFRAALVPVAERGKRAVIVATANEVLVAYSNLNFSSPCEGAAHVHILDATSRGKGLATVLFAPALRVYFDEFRLERLRFETSPRNEIINKLLAKFGLVPVERYLERPDGMAKAGTFLVYDLTADKARALLNPQAAG